MKKVTKDGRVILTGKDYTLFRRRLYNDQGMKCDRCKVLCSLDAPLISRFSFHVHHVHGRGMGGGKRDDTPESCVGLCGHCHQEEHDS